MNDDEVLMLVSLVTAGGMLWWMMNQKAMAADNADQPDTTSDFESELTYQVSDLGLSLGIDDMAKIWTPPAAAAPYLSAIAAAESRYGLPTNMLARLLYQESHFRPDIINGTTKSSVGALGIAQFMPATARQFGIDPLNPFQAIDAAGKYLAQLYRQFGNWADALAAYNWGPGNVKRKGIAAAPAETQSYFGSILADLGFGSATA